MLFNSVAFFVFLPIVFCAYWTIGARRVRAQNLLILVSSYVFYGWWDYRFLGLIAFSSLLDYFLGLGLARTKSLPKRKSLLAVSLLANLGLLAIFKYFHFFIESFERILPGEGFQSFDSLQVILPVGISFYTFQSLSYTIDVYRRKTPASRDPVEFLAYVSFFPQLVAGPIERATHFLPQFQRSRQFDSNLARDGVRQILWGLFKKVVVADTCAASVEAIFAAPDHEPGLVLILGTILFSFQIYGDFSGYSDIAIGTGRLFGFDLMRNFAYPYFARNIYEFWKRWHISLTTWFRDYVYIPLGGNRHGQTRHLINIWVVFVVSGLWHGANNTFLVWGAIHGLFYTLWSWFGKNSTETTSRSNLTLRSAIQDTVGVISTFSVVTFAWIFFRSPSVESALHYISRIIAPPFFGPSSAPRVPLALLLILFLGVFEWKQRRRRHPLEFEGLSIYVRWPIYYGLGFLILLFFRSGMNFIYFQF